MKALFAEYLTWGAPNRVGSHYYAQHLMEQGWDVGWLGGEFHPLNFVQNRAELRRKAPSWLRGGVRHEGGPWEYVPCKLLPYRDWGPLRSLDLAWHGYRYTVPPVRHTLTRAGFLNADLLWLSNPQAYPWLVDEPGFRHTVYRAADNHANYWGVPHNVQSVEYRIARRVDAVFVVHPTDMDRFREAAPDRTVYLPNGVDLRRYNRVHEVPPEYTGIAGPIAVYVGGINPRVDMALLAEAAARRTDVTFVLIGPVQADLSAIRGRPNVLVLGPRPAELVPGYLLHARVGLVPFREIAASHNLRSLKIYEYAAAGLPIIHTSMSPEAAADLPVLTARGVSDFMAALERALASGPGEREAARAFAAANSWDDRYLRVDAILGAW